MAVELKPRHHVVFFSVSEALELSAVTHINVLYVIALQLFRSARRLKLDIPDNTVKTILGWNQQILQSKGGETTQGVELELNLQLISVKLQQEKLFRDELETAFAKRLSDLVEQINRLAIMIQTQTKDCKPVLVIIDDLDKLDLSVVEEVYQKNIKALFSPVIRIVFTIPVSAIQEPQIMGSLNSAGVVRPYTFPVAKFFSRNDRHKPDVEPIQKTLEVFLNILKQRIPEHLIEADTATQIVVKSGGLLRELVRLGRECCIECMVQLETNPNVAKINGTILNTAIRNIRNDFSRQISANLYEILIHIYREGVPLDRGDSGFVKLLHGLMILEYENDSLWYDVHPIVVDLLKQNQLVT